MTEIKAIKILQSNLHLDCKVKEAIEELEARKVAVKALEKQIAKKIERIDNGEAFLCPCCGIDFMGAFNDTDHDPCYCFECGQALDWSGEDAE
jgi:rubrerythrin